MSVHFLPTLQFLVVVEEQLVGRFSQCSACAVSINIIIGFVSKRQLPTFHFDSPTFECPNSVVAFKKNTRTHTQHISYTSVRKIEEQVMKELRADAKQKQRYLKGRNRLRFSNLRNPQINIGIEVNERPLFVGSHMAPDHISELSGGTQSF